MSAGSCPALNTSAAAAAAAAAAAGAPHLQGTWSCDLGLLAAASAAVGASAAAASGAEQLDILMPLRPLAKSHSVGRGLLSRYSRGGEASNSPTGSSGYGLAACLLAAHPSSSSSGGASSSGAAEVGEQQQEEAPAAATGAVIAATMAVLDAAGSRPMRRMTSYDD
jgi:hypothetical protein